MQIFACIGAHHIVSLSLALELYVCVCNLVHFIQGQSSQRAVELISLNSIAKAGQRSHHDVIGTKPFHQAAQAVAA